MSKKAAILLVFLGLVYVTWKTLVMNGVTYINDIYVNSIALENTNNIVQILLGIAVVIGAFIGVWQYVLTAKCERTKMETDKVQKAIDLSEYYKDNVLNNFVAIQYVFNHSGIADILSNIKSIEMTEFDTQELNRLLCQADIEKLDKIMRSEKIIQTIIDMQAIYGLDMNVSKYVKIKKSDDEEEKEFEINGNALIRDFMSNVIMKTLNNLEYFAMYFTHGTADETVVFQSLHKTYIQIVQRLYYDISRNNKLGAPKLYTNVIDLYHIWNKRSLEQQNDVANSTRKNISSGTVVKAID